MKTISQAELIELTEFPELKKSAYSKIHGIRASPESFRVQDNCHIICTKGEK
jgi:hypothetical protein